MVEKKKQINYKFMPTSLFRGCPRIRGFNENKLYLYIYIYIHPFTKTLLFIHIYDICINTEERLKQRGHTLHQLRGVTITYNFCF